MWILYGKNPRAYRAEIKKYENRYYADFLLNLKDYHLKCKVSAIGDLN